MKNGSLLLLIGALLACHTVGAGRAKVIPDSLLSFMESLRVGYKPAHNEQFTEEVNSRSSTPMFAAEDFNGDGLTDYIVIAVGNSGPKKLIGFINGGDGSYSYYFLGNIYDYDKKLEVFLSEYLESIASGLDGSGSLNDWKEIKLENPGVRFASISRDQIIYWSEGKFHKLSSSD